MRVHLSRRHGAAAVWHQECRDRRALRGHAAAALAERGLKCLVVACNTASASSLPAMRERLDGVPIVGVIEPGAQAACEASSPDASR